MSKHKTSWLYLLNFLLLQWIFLRLARKLDDDGKQKGWTWLFPVMPMSGWGSDYVWVWRRR